MRWVDCLFLKIRRPPRSTQRRSSAASDVYKGQERRIAAEAAVQVDNVLIRDDGEAGEWQDWLVDNSPNQEAIMAEHEEFDHRRQALNGAIGVLNPRERRIFEARRLAEDPMTLEDLATEFGVSRERVRQIEVRAFEKVQSAVKGTIARQEQAALEAAH